MQIAQYFSALFYHATCNHCGAKMQVLYLDENGNPIDPMSLYNTEHWNSWVGQYLGKINEHMNNCTAENHYLNDADVYFSPINTNPDTCQSSTDCPYNAGGN
ncbi:hypothetical protein [Scytonema sp. NUACC26]|uniref:hypothetical protein n=1 Tax=Scytonema sp. NUACC26 TaxID=3140176 RepID=UPI0034DC6512